MCNGAHAKYVQFVWRITKNLSISVAAPKICLQFHTFRLLVIGSKQYKIKERPIIRVASEDNFRGGHRHQRMISLSCCVHSQLHGKKFNVVFYILHKGHFL